MKIAGGYGIPRLFHILLTAFDGFATMKKPLSGRVLPGGSRRSALPVKGVLLMVTYSDLIQVGILIVSLCTLVFQICKKK